LAAECRSGDGVRQHQRHPSGRQRRTLAVDTGSPEFGGNPLPDGAKLVRIDLATNRVAHVVPMGPETVLPGSYVDDIRFNGDFAYLTDAGQPGRIVLNQKTGAMRRVLDKRPATTAPANRPIVLNGETLKSPDGSVLRVNSDPLEVSTEGKWLYFAPLSALVADRNAVARRFFREPGDYRRQCGAMDGSAANRPDSNGCQDRRITTVIRDERLHWADAPFIDSDHSIWLRALHRPVLFIVDAELAAGPISPTRATTYPNRIRKVGFDIEIMPAALHHLVCGRPSAHGF
jgi:hypothetical protein